MWKQAKKHTQIISADFFFISRGCHLLRTPLQGVQAKFIDIVMMHHKQFHEKWCFRSLSRPGHFSQSVRGWRRSYRCLAKCWLDANRHQVTRTMTLLLGLKPPLQKAQVVPMDTEKPHARMLRHIWEGQESPITCYLSEGCTPTGASDGCSWSCKRQHKFLQLESCDHFLKP